jgi:RNA polymerase sigma factor (sigma-70 family)
VTAPGDVERLSSLLEAHRPLLVRWMERHASGLRRFESAEDLAQGVSVRALEAVSRYEHRSDPEFVGWMLAVARQHVADRHAFWRALKRDAGPVLRLTFGGASEPGGGAPEPSASATGAVTFSDRREAVARATRTLAALGERDADLVRQVVNDVSVEETAQRLGVSYEAAQRARLRAVERLRKLYALASRPRA